MGITLKYYFVLMGFIMLALSQPLHSQPVKSNKPLNEQYSQKTLLKNWTLSVCLAIITKDAATRNDANESASGYLEFGKQDLDAYDKLRKLAQQFANLKYSSPTHAELNVMKCIDLFHSKELDKLAGKLSKQR